jgi:hypothetical protein
MAVKGLQHEWTDLVSASRMTVLSLLMIYYQGVEVEKAF